MSEVKRYYHSQYEPHNLSETSSDGADVYVSYADYKVCADAHKELLAIVDRFLAQSLAVLNKIK